MGTRRFWFWVLAVAILASASLFVATREPGRVEPAGRGSGTSGPDPTLSTAPREAPAPQATAAPGPRTAAGDAEVEALRRALAAADVDGARAAARDLRLRLRTDPAALAHARTVLLEPATGADLRMALALVLGTLPGEASDAVLLQAIERFAEDVAFVRCALLALGAQREPEDDDDVFALGDRPYGASGPGGLGITVRRSVPPEGEVEKALVLHLGRTEPEVRGAAARALGQSLAAAPVRAAFLAALRAEKTDDVAAALGEPLAAWAGSAADAQDREAILATLIDLAREPGFDAYRFRMEKEFDRLPLSSSERAALAGLAQSDRPYAIRAFALTALARAAARGGEPVAWDARRALLAAGADADAAVRDLAAHWLGRLPYDRDTASRLATTARQDPAWNVRFSALEALAATAPREEYLPVLEAAKGDADRRVAERAAALLRGATAPL